MQIKLSHIRTKINGETWIFRVVSPEKMAEIDGGTEAPAGRCEPKDKEVLINTDYLDLGTITHEMFHVYASDLHLEDTNEISLEDLEEIYATMIEKKGDKMIRQAKRVYNKLKKLVDA